MALAATLIAPASAWAEQTPEILGRIGKWDLAYDDKGCDLVASFGEGNDQVTAKFTRFSPRDGLKITLYGERFRSQSLTLPLTVDFGEPRISFEADGIFGKTGNRPTVALLRRADATTVPVPDTSSQQIDFLTFAFQGKRPFRLALGKFDAAVDALGRCTDNVVKEWGYDPAEQAAAVKAPEPLVPVTRWLRSGDYPRHLLREGQSGIIQFRLDISDQGNVDSCVIVSATSHKGFADTTCRLISERARFSPAQDVNGRPMRSYYVGIVNWLARI